MKKVVYTIFVLFCFMLTSNLFAQKELGKVGEIFTKEEANKLFGKVNSVVKIKVDELKKAIQSVDKYVMFKMAGDNALVTDSKRNIKMGPQNYRLAAGDVMHLYSKSVLEELLSKSSEEYVSLEMRDEVFTVTYGTVTLERSVHCPPFCD